MKEPHHSLLSIYHSLFRRFGPQHWWPGRTPYEVMVGAILTQNTNWGNVEKAIAGLRKARLLTPRALLSVPESRLAAVIRPAGYYNIKARRLRSFTEFFIARYKGKPALMAAEDPQRLRGLLLSVNGIGEETCDSILLYAVGVPVFVVDAYTKRIFSRHRFFPAESDYRRVQALFTGHVPARLFNEYHALIVRLGKEYCRKTNPRCDRCPVHNIR